MDRYMPKRMYASASMCVHLTLLGGWAAARPSFVKGSASWRLLGQGAIAISSPQIWLRHVGIHEQVWACMGTCEYMRLVMFIQRIGNCHKWSDGECHTTMTIMFDYVWLCLIMSDKYCLKYINLLIMYDYICIIACSGDPLNKYLTIISMWVSH